MARATTTKASARKPRMAATKPSAKRKPGRPVGSTNTKKAPAISARVAKAPAKAATRTAVAKPAAAAPKMSKAELESHVSKLERTVSRLRDKNKELKQAASDAREHADTLEMQLTSRATPEPAKASRRSRRSTGTPVAEETDTSTMESPEG